MKLTKVQARKLGGIITHGAAHFGGAALDRPRARRIAARISELLAENE